MKTLEFIKEKGWQALTDELGIEVREYDCGLRVLNYSQIDSPKMHPVVQECRALKLHVDGTVVSRAFNRFLNYGEGDTKDFDFSDCTVYEKADGSFVAVYFYNGRWEISTRGTAFAEAPHVFGLKTDWTFRAAILDAMGFTEEQFQACMNSQDFHKSCTYVMEYTSPYNRIVTPYEKPEMVLIAVVSNITFIEAKSYSLKEWVEVFKSKGMNIRMPDIHLAWGVDAIVKMAESLDGLKEGFVVYDNKTGKRVKIKSSVYCAVHHLRGNGTPTRNSLMELVLKNEQAELLTYFPEYSAFVEPVELALGKLTHDATVMYDLHKGIETQKDFALAVKDTDVAPIMFKARKDNTSAYFAFEGMELNQKLRLLDKYLG